MRRFTCFLGLSLVLCAACGDDDDRGTPDLGGPGDLGRIDSGPMPGDSGTDLGPDDDDMGPDECTEAADCDDGLFCNGAETCDPTSANADASGCVLADAPCESACDEAMDMCAVICMDADGDGFLDDGCGGNDCNDGNPAINPDATELCDGVNDDNCNGTVDEDCDCSTGDTMVCGSSVGECSEGIQMCDGGTFGACSGAVGPVDEICNHLDDDCNGTYDASGLGSPVGVASCEVEVSASSGFPLEFKCEGGSCRAAGGRLAITDDGGEAVAAYFHDGPLSGSGTRVDLAASQEVEGEFTVSGFNATENTRFGVMVSPERTAGSFANFGLPTTSGADRFGYAAIYVAVERRLHIYELTSTGPIDRGMSAPLPATCNAGAVDQSFAIELTTSRALTRATVTGTSATCTDTAMVEYTFPNWQEDLYVVGSGYARYSIGAVSAGADGVTTLLSRFRVRRGRLSLGGPNHCVSCPW